MPVVPLSRAEVIHEVENLGANKEVLGGIVESTHGEEAEDGGFVGEGIEELVLSITTTSHCEITAGSTQQFHLALHNSTIFVTVTE